jgi:hypothetical protein
VAGAIPPPLRLWSQASNEYSRLFFLRHRPLLHGQSCGIRIRCKVGSTGKLVSGSIYYPSFLLVVGREQRHHRDPFLVVLRSVPDRTQGPFVRIRFAANLANPEKRCTWLISITIATSFLPFIEKKVPQSNIPYHGEPFGQRGFGIPRNRTFAELRPKLKKDCPINAARDKPGKLWS